MCEGEASVFCILLESFLNFQQVFPIFKLTTKWEKLARKLPNYVLVCIYFVTYENK